MIGRSSLSLNLNLSLSPMPPKDARLAKVRDFNLVLKYGRWFAMPKVKIKVLDLAKIVNYYPKKATQQYFDSS